jgi:hypothetical protein
MQQIESLKIHRSLFRNGRSSVRVFEGLFDCGNTKYYAAKPVEVKERVMYSVPGTVLGSGFRRASDQNSGKSPGIIIWMRLQWLLKEKLLND